MTPEIMRRFLSSVTYTATSEEYVEAAEMMTKLVPALVARWTDKELMDIWAEVNKQLVDEFVNNNKGE